ncbi:class I adenylate-forming enzyme family protein [Streptomyces rimosus]|uniref:class I adenylate-forming enzyme family protein n=1 Tax=Streptomyces rimosus TaxID=1927 RepID=UPI000B14CB03|nr:long-chain fatty acid--CoA ligase [Streptomyces rimosus]
MNQPAESPLPRDHVFPHALVDAFRRQPDTAAFEHRGRAVPRREVLDRAARCVRGLRAAGIGPGSSVAVAAGVTPETFALHLAVHLLGARLTGLRPGLPPRHLAQILSDGIDVLVHDEPSGTPELFTAAGDIGRLRLEKDLLSTAVATSPDDLVPRGRPDDIALITLTSGSTGQPKRCAHTYRSLSASWSWQPARWTARTSALAAAYARFLLFGTLTSAVIFEHLGLCLLGGGTAVIPDPPPSFPEVFARHRITACLLTVPRLYHILDTLRTEPVDTSSLRALLVAGSPLAPHRLAEATERLGPVVHQGYGQTETGMLTLLTPDDLAHGPRSAYGTVGRPLDGVEIDVRDPDGGQPPADGATGEIWVRTAGALAGYWHDEAETRAVLRDGWVRTRDLGRLDEHGFLRLTGRTREVIIVNAVLHYAGAIEQALARHPDVDQAYVVGAPDERTGEAAHAFVVPTAERRPDPAALRTHVAAELGPASVPATITVIAEVPVAGSGKPDKRALLGLVGGGGPVGGGGSVAGAAGGGGPVGGAVRSG